MRPTVSVRAPAKVNLLLRVLGRRTDGFHELETLFQAIDFTDELTVELAGDSVDLEVAGEDVGPVSKTANRMPTRLTSWSRRLKSCWHNCAAHTAWW